MSETKVPKASLLRRIGGWRRNVSERVHIARLRRLLGKHLPRAPWRVRQETATNVMRADTEERGLAFVILLKWEYDAPA